MIIADLLQGLEIKEREGPLDTEIMGIAYDSRSADKGFLFVAIKGLSFNGDDFIKDAINRGAAAVITERPIADMYASYPPSLLSGVTCIEVHDSRSALASISARFYREPSKSISLIGITGTNGKTTTSYITKSIIEACGKKAGLLGTIQYIAGETKKAERTTPESLDLQRYLREMLDNGMEYAVIEVSSHALALQRVEQCVFKAAAFTNFTQDHLDFHGSMDNYFLAKDKLFNYLDEEGTAVLNWDDPAVREVEERLNCNIVTCGLLEGATIRAENIDDSAGLSFDLITPGGRFRAGSEFIGRFNVYNILISAGIAYALGIGEDAILKGIAEARPVSGRFERVDEGQDFLCIVDYAHTDDALKAVINEARMITKGRVITLFGCGGDRDRTKRELMGDAASELSDLVIVTSDNPRTEGPLQIISDIVKGIKKKNHMEVPDRTEAINKAVSMAEAGDVLLIAGKGHEDYQEISGIRYPFSDKEVLREALKNIKEKK
ncbi:MAG: UDP-N-acetylmuramoyl-L-alanyl-D-glutamate--2,6-diaminopimelate ligase [Nitrospirae bacterium]|nr:UDP-N-acetylmuramoyl-L-alanyl-D-glutamate--2,6-diaminopimelate ligase [Nitrospirota bacterium]